MRKLGPAAELVSLAAQKVAIVFDLANGTIHHKLGQSTPAVHKREKGMKLWPTDATRGVLQRLLIGREGLTDEMLNNLHGRQVARPRTETKNSILNYVPGRKVLHKPFTPGLRELLAPQFVNSDRVLIYSPGSGFKYAVVASNGQLWGDQWLQNSLEKVTQSRMPCITRLALVEKPVFGRTRMLSGDEETGISSGEVEALYVRFGVVNPGDRMMRLEDPHLRWGPGLSRRREMSHLYPLKGQNVQPSDPTEFVFGPNQTRMLTVVFVAPPEEEDVELSKLHWHPI